MMPAGDAMEQVEDIQDPPVKEYRFRNHPSVMIANLIVVVFILGIMWFTTLGDVKAEYRNLINIGFVAFGAILFITIFFWWKRTYYIFEQTELHVTRDTVFRMDKHIKYNRLASVSVKRSIFNVIFGTSTLVFNVNSSVNASAAEATLVLEKPIADELRNRLSTLIFDKEISISEELSIDTAVKVSNADVIINSLFGQSTVQSLFGLAMFIYAVVMLYFQNSGGFITSAILFVFSVVVPFVSSIFRYYNYRIYRVGDTITVESGLIATRRNSFKINKVNAIRIRQPLLSRLIRRVMLEAEVVGMANGDETYPLLCPMKSRRDIELLISEIIPEFMFEPSPVHQPKRALIPMIITNAISSAVIITTCILLFTYIDSYAASLEAYWREIVMASEIVAAVMLPIIIFGRIGMAQKYRMFDVGEDMFMVVSGGYDISTCFINFDKVQFVNVFSGPLQRCFGLAKCSVHMMSSKGASMITSGLFDPEELEAVPDNVMARIRDGRYDYRNYL